MTFLSQGPHLRVVVSIFHPWLHTAMSKNIKLAAVATQMPAVLMCHLHKGTLTLVSVGKRLLPWLLYRQMCAHLNMNWFRTLIMFKGHFPPPPFPFRPGRHGAI